MDFFCAKYVDFKNYFNLKQVREFHTKFMDYKSNTDLKKNGLWKACGFEISMRISKIVHGFEKYLYLIKLQKFGKNTGI